MLGILVGCPSVGVSAVGRGVYRHLLALLQVIGKSAEKAFLAEHCVGGL